MAKRKVGKTASIEQEEDSNFFLPNVPYQGINEIANESDNI